MFKLETKVSLHFAKIRVYIVHKMDGSIVNYTKYLKCESKTQQCSQPSGKSLWSLLQSPRFEPLCVAEPPKLSRLKCAGHHHKGNTSSNALQTEQSLVCRVTSRYSHRFSDRTSIPRTKASSEILQPQFYNTGIVKITNQFKSLLQNQTQKIVIQAIS